MFKILVSLIVNVLFKGFLHLQFSIIELHPEDENIYTNDAVYDDARMIHEWKACFFIPYDSK